MRRKISMTLMTALLSVVAFAAGDWKGKVVDEKGEPVPFANVVAISKADSTVLAGATAAEDGSFNIVTDGKNQLLMVSMIGYKTRYVTPSDTEFVNVRECHPNHRNMEPQLDCRISATVALHRRT